MVFFPAFLGPFLFFTSAAPTDVCSALVIAAAHLGARIHVRFGLRSLTRLVYAARSSPYTTHTSRLSLCFFLALDVKGRHYRE